MRWFWRLVPHRHRIATEAVLWGTATIPVEPYCTRCLGHFGGNGERAD